jgi:hypothetical protein
VVLGVDRGGHVHISAFYVVFRGTALMGAAA